MSSWRPDYNLCLACYEKKRNDSGKEHIHIHDCDSCRTSPIEGLRFKSLSKKNCDLCLACFDALSKCEQDCFVQVYRRFFRMPEPVSLDIDALTSVLSIEHEGKSGEVVHTGIACNQCSIEPIQGRRFKSYKMSDYNLCLACFERGSKDAGDYAHRVFSCDICNAVPIRGPRYASCTKSSYDLCRNCFAEKDKAEQSEYVEVNWGVYGLVHPALAKESGMADKVSGSPQGVQSTAHRDHHFDKMVVMEIATDTMEMLACTIEIVSLIVSALSG